ncbi:hypothetical protein MLD38_006135 [Melastoma candidum]|uniref:Uncharacterized protein n=1 Tax=Melastoma candidum TaxID=119954 RepID=A0ACB9RPY8_9MYRT|nr:hypothetical protein MLD38_006135 [Melastoma candidum]
MELLVVFVSLCFVSSGLFLRSPVEAAPLYDFVSYGADGNQGYGSRVRFRPLDPAALSNADEFGDEDTAVDDDNIDGYLDKANGRFGPSDITYGLPNVKYDPSGEPFGRAKAAAIYNVVDFGAKGDKNDDSQAFTKAWDAACQDGGSPTFLVPGGKTFKLTPTVFPGPCKFKSVNVQIDGTLVAPKSISQWKECPLGSWLLFSDLSNLNVSGRGKLNGRGASWWDKSTAQQPMGYRFISCSGRPTSLKFHNCQNLELSGLRSINSPRNHISINRCTNVTISYIQLIAPDESPNTDGINIATSSDINIHHSSITTGDDCVAINSNTFGVSITDVRCGPGHGISVGSLGAQGSTAFVSDIYVARSTFVGSQNGARIKTWQGGSGEVKNVVFEDITLVQARHPIIIDQFYCPGKDGCGTSSRNLKITNVTYSRIRGTSDSEAAIKFDCAKNSCTGIGLNQVNIRRADPNPSLIGVIAYSATNYFASDTLMKAYKRVLKQGKVENIETLFIGSAAGAISSTASFPLEVARKHMQVGALNGRQVYKNVIDAITSILEQEGVQGLYMGLGPSCMKLVPPVGLSFMCSKACKRILIEDDEVLSRRK